MPFDPTKPATNSPNSSAEMRGQLTSLNADIQTRATLGDLAAAISGTSSNSNAVATLNQGANGGYDPNQMQQILDKIDELINALRRQGPAAAAWAHSSCPIFGKGANKAPSERTNTP